MNYIENSEYYDDRRYNDLVDTTSDYPIIIDMAAHSMGGNVIRSMLNYEAPSNNLFQNVNSGLNNRIGLLKKVIFIASPLAGVENTLIPDLQATQLQTGSSFLTRLPNYLPINVEIYSIYGIESSLSSIIVAHSPGYTDSWDGLVKHSSAVAFSNIKESWSLGESHGSITSSPEGINIIKYILSNPQPISHRIGVRLHSTNYYAHHVFYFGGVKLETNSGIEIQLQFSLKYIGFTVYSIDTYKETTIDSLFTYTITPTQLLYSANIPFTLASLSYDITLTYTIYS